MTGVGNRRIVVGVDGGETSLDALRWAAEEAEVRDCALDVVYGWQVSTEPRPDGVGIGVAPSAEEYARAARERIEAVVAETLPAAQRDRATVHIVHKPAGKALVAQAVGADLLVIGSSSQGRLAKWLLGSVVDSAVQNAPCAVALIRPGCVPGAAPDDGDADDGGAEDGGAEDGAAADELTAAEGAGQQREPLG